MTIWGESLVAPIYDRDDIKERLLPRLGEAQRVGPLEMLKIQIAMRHPQGIIVVLVALGLLAYGAVRVFS